MPRVPLSQKIVGDTPKDFDIILPSSFAAEKRSSMGLKSLADHELKLRLDQAREALLELRVCIQRFSIAVDEKQGKWSERGQKATTRMEGQIRRLQQSVQGATKTYRTIYKALVCLGLPPDHKCFRPLKDADMSGSRRIWRELSLGQGRKKVPWIWTAPLTFDTSNALDWNREANRVQWHRAEANVNRWTEEVEKLRAELQRASIYYKFYANAWGSLICKKPQTGLDLGGNAFCCKQSSMYQRLAEACDRAKNADSNRGGEEYLSSNISEWLSQAREKC
ncbi:hypothetical protein BOTBODRAFT_54827 [Botryobasidium botryosum FD-172 SS1]|uniref:Uncharacterized protein n=1 Tax=Botryobasidium botryosum (strain FD-172 SS1) TaxID=930990 RepID=A0A067MKF5_BOTB1|nr:hypothetical protein BOTBODRAFT_54827 [Botryobasidium botryosum FD-172 SS1]